MSFSAAFCFVDGAPRPPPTTRWVRVFVTDDGVCPPSARTRSSALARSSDSAPVKTAGRAAQARKCGELFSKLTSDGLAQPLDAETSQQDIDVELAGLVDFGEQFVGEGRAESVETNELGARQVIEIGGVFDEAAFDQLLSDGLAESDDVDVLAPVDQAADPRRNALIRCTAQQEVAFADDGGAA